MKHSERLLYFHHLGLNIETNNFEQCVDELIRRHKELLDYKEAHEKDFFRTALYNIEKYPN